MKIQILVFLYRSSNKAEKSEKYFKGCESVYLSFAKFHTTSQCGSL